jgi:hypothetical protein
LVRSESHAGIRVLRLAQIPQDKYLNVGKFWTERYQQVRSLSGRHVFLQADVKEREIALFPIDKVQFDKVKCCGNVPGMA